MKKHFITLLLLILAISASQASSQRNLLSSKFDIATITQAITTAENWVPYPHYSNRAAWDSIYGKNKAAIILRGERQLNYQWKYIPFTNYLEYEKSGNRNIMQNPNSENNNALADLVIAELAEGKGRFMPQIINGVFYNCERSSWVLSAHLPAQQSKRATPDFREQVIDLGSAELGAFLSWVHYFFKAEFDKVDPMIAARLHHELTQKIILPYRNNDHFWWLAFHPRPDGMVNNWNPWTNFNCIQTIALLETDMAQLSSDVHRSMRSVDKFINYVNEDGACEEGPSYWGHAAGKLYDYLELLQLMSNGNLSIMNHKMIKDMGEYISRSYVGNDWVVNFADASARFSSNAGVIFRYGKAVNSAEMMGFAAHLVQEKGKNPISFGIDFFRYLESLRYNEELMNYPTKYSTPDITIYNQTQFYYFKNNKAFLAVKGGYNAESHNHNDAGTFSLWVNQSPVLIDAGVGTYVRQTFGPERYSIWTMRSNYHNLPSINNVEQAFGKEYKARNIKINSKNKSIVMDIAGAYPDSANVKTWNRTYKLENNRLLIDDAFELRKATKHNSLHFMLWGDIVLKNGVVELIQNGKTHKLLYDKNAFEATIDTIALDDSRLSNVWGDKIYRLNLKAKKISTKGKYNFSILF